MPLAFADMGSCYTVKRINGRDEIHRHLENLGLVAGSEVSVVSKTSSGLIVNVKGSRVALGQDLASKIFV